MLLKYRYTILISRLWSGRHFPELSRHVVDSTLFHIALCANQFRVWNRYHIMTPVYASVIYSISFFFLHSFPSETSPEHFNRVFSTCAVRKTKTLGTEWMLVVDWLIFGHGVFPAVKSNRVENAPCDVTREILLNIIHTHQIKKDKKKLRNLFTPSAIFFVTKFHVFAIMSKLSYQPSIFIISTKQNRSQFSWTVPSYSFCIKWNCGCDGTERGFT